MIIVSGVNSKRVNDPVFLSARKFMDDRIAKLQAQGPSKELTRALQRYSGLTAKDVMIEPPVTFPDGRVLCCFVSRKTGFFRADIEVQHVDVRLIFDEFSVVVTEYDTVDDLVGKIKIDEQVEGVVFIKSTGEYGIVTTALNSGPDYLMQLMGDIYWDRIVADAADAIDTNTKSTGTFSVEAININTLQGKLFFIEDVKALT